MIKNRILIAAFAVNNTSYANFTHAESSRDRGGEGGGRKLIPNEHGIMEQFFFLHAAVQVHILKVVVSFLSL